ncbi:hypothetical protein ACFFRE_08615 [Aciditerrimonas ferrireducens]|uniref:DUF4149 domain-containing protein n=1 Tax=Aciditerrimonas ferrireducens TaxID=667306 RepID=A0ABV6C3H2_9ACTN
MTELRTQTARAPGGATAPATAAPAAAPGAPGAEALPIVPVRGLPVVGLVLAGLVAAIATNGLWAIDFFHVVAGGIWTTLDLFLGFVLGPILARLSVPARVELTRRLMPKLLLIMPTVVLCTLAAGWQLARHEGNLLASSPNHPWVVASMIVVAVMAVVALGILEPANLAVLFELRRPQPDGRVVGRLMRRFIATAAVTGAMQVATLVIMTRLAT